MASGTTHSSGADTRSVAMNVVTARQEPGRDRGQAATSEGAGASRSPGRARPQSRKRR